MPLDRIPCILCKSESAVLRRRKCNNIFRFRFTVPPVIHVPNQLVGAPLGTDVVLECFVEASPMSINYWVKDPKGEMTCEMTREMSSLKIEFLHFHNGSLFHRELRFNITTFSRNVLFSHRVFLCLLIL